jgi:3-oxoacyl-[acyl-carrier-protein] synthase II
MSGATGVPAITAEERQFLEQHGDLAVRAAGSYLGHGMEPTFPLNIALAAIALGRGNLFPSNDSTGLERPMDGELSQVLVTSVGHWRGEGLALLEKAG